MSARTRAAHDPASAREHERVCGRPRTTTPPQGATPFGRRPGPPPMPPTQNYRTPAPRTSGRKPAPKSYLDMPERTRHRLGRDRLRDHLRSSRDHPFGNAVETFVRREDAERFVEEVRSDDPELASYLRIEERELGHRRGVSAASGTLLISRSSWLRAAETVASVGPRAGDRLDQLFREHRGRAAARRARTRGAASSPSSRRSGAGPQSGACYRDRSRARMVARRKLSHASR